MSVLPRCEVHRLGRMEYPEALALQEELVACRRRNEIVDQLLLVEHPHVLTMGSSTREEHILFDATQRRRLGITLHETTRGGDVTYHGPGQLVGYPILQLQGGERDAHEYLRRLEETLIRSLAVHGIPSGRHPEYTGVWVGDAKLAAIGVRLSRWVTSHGFALNVDCDLSYFDAIVPCGIQEKRVGSMAQFMDDVPSLDEVNEVVSRSFATVFERDLVPVESPRSRQAGERS